MKMKNHIGDRQWRRVEHTQEVFVLVKNGHEIIWLVMLQGEVVSSDPIVILDEATHLVGSEGLGRSQQAHLLPPAALWRGEWCRTAGRSDMMDDPAGAQAEDKAMECGPLAKQRSSADRGRAGVGAIDGGRARGSR
jgi:hypothetical protein